MALYKVGDRVVIRPDLNAHDDYYMIDELGNRMYEEGNCAVGEMIAAAGQVVTIQKNNGQYYVEEMSWCWTDEMFSGLESEVCIPEQIQDVDQVALMEMIGG